MNTKKQVLLIIIILIATAVITTTIVGMINQRPKNSQYSNPQLDSLLETAEQLNKLVGELQQSYQDSQDTLKKQQETLGQLTGNNASIPTKELNTIKAIYDEALDSLDLSQSSTSLIDWFTIAKPLYDKACQDVMKATTATERDEIIKKFDEDIKKILPEDNDQGNSSQTPTGSGSGSQGGNQGGNQGGSQGGNQGGSQGGNQGGNQSSSGDNNRIWTTEEAIAALQDIYDIYSEMISSEKVTQANNLLNHAKQRVRLATTDAKIEEIIAQFEDDFLALR